MKNSRIIIIFKKEIIEIKRDPYTLGIAILMPLILLLLFGYALNLDVKNITTIVFDQDKSLHSRDYVQSITSTDYFNVKYYVNTYSEIEKLINQGKAKTAIIIPGNFAQNIVSGTPTTVETIVDGTFPPTAKVSIGYITAINEMFDLINETGFKKYISNNLPPIEKQVEYLTLLRRLT